MRASAACSAIFNARAIWRLGQPFARERRPSAHAGSAGGAASQEHSVLGPRPSGAALKTTPDSRPPDACHRGFASPADSGENSRRRPGRVVVTAASGTARNRIAVSYRDRRLARHRKPSPIYFYGPTIVDVSTY